MYYKSTPEQQCIMKHIIGTTTCKVQGVTGSWHRTPQDHARWRQQGEDLETSHDAVQEMYVDEAGKQQEKAYSCKAFHNGKEEQHIKEDPCEGGHDDEQGPEVIPGKEDDHDDAEQAEPGLKPVKA